MGSAQSAHTVLASRWLQGACVQVARRNVECCHDSIKSTTLLGGIYTIGFRTSAQQEILVEKPESGKTEWAEWDAAFILQDCVSPEQLEI